MQLILKQLSEIKPYENNPRKNDKAVDAVVESINQCSYIAPIIVDEDGVILAGHTRYKALKKLGRKEAEVIVKEGLTDEQKRKYRILDNKTNEFAEWDFDLLKDELDGLDFDGFDFGFDIGDNAEREIVEDEAPEVDETSEPKAKLGDIYQLGRHRLVCGDSTSADDVDILMNGDKADMVFTDPPYNVNYTDGRENERKILNDYFKTDEECGEKLWLPAFTNMRNVSNDCCSYYCCMPQGGTHMMMMMMMMKAGWQVKHEIIWKKQSIVLNRADYNYQHEPILFGWNKTHIFYGKGKFHTTSVWEIDRPTKSKEHPTMKPLELICEALHNSSKKGDIVIDLFGGSGSTLIACERLDRICYMMELDPKYVDVIIQRWEKLTGEKAVMLNGDRNREVE